MLIMRDNGFKDFGSVDNLLPASGSAVTFENLGGYASVGISVNIPSGGKVLFEGSFDSVNYSPIVLRSLAGDGYTQTSKVSDNYLGSISNLRFFRVKMLESGTSTGYVIGRATLAPTTLEGIENQAPPHKFGHRIVNSGFAITGQTTSGIIFAPTSGKRFVLTDLHFSVGQGSGANVSIFDEVNNTSNWIYNSDYETAPSGGALRTILDFTVPYLSLTTGNKLRITTSAARNVNGVIHGYEAD